MSNRFHLFCWALFTWLVSATLPDQSNLVCPDSLRDINSSTHPCYITVRLEADDFGGKILTFNRPFYQLIVQGDCSCRDGESDCFKHYAPPSNLWFVHSVQGFVLQSLDVGLVHPPLTIQNGMPLTPGCNYTMYNSELKLENLHTVCMAGPDTSISRMRCVFHDDLICSHDNAKRVAHRRTVLDAFDVGVLVSVLRTGVCPVRSENISKVTDIVCSRLCFCPSSSVLGDYNCDGTFDDSDIRAVSADVF